MSELARRVGASRPSASRAVHALESRAFVRAAGRGWSLTAEGRVEVASIAAPGQDYIRAALKEARRLDDLDLGSLAVLKGAWALSRHTYAFSAAIEAVHVGAASKLHAADAFSGVMKAAAGMTEVGLASKMPDTGLGVDGPTLTSRLISEGISAKVGQSVLDDAVGRFSAGFGAGAWVAAREAQSVQAEMFGKSLALAMSSHPRLRIPDALTEALKSQQYLVSGMVAAATFAPKFMPDLSKSLALSGRMVADATGLDQLLSSRRRAVQMYGRPLAKYAIEVLTAHTSNVKAAFESSDVGTRFGASLLGPTETSGHYVAGLRGLLERPKREDDDAAFGHDPSLYIRELRRLDPVAADNWQAAYDRVREAGPSWSIQASHVARESLRLVLKRLSPDAPAAPSGKVHTETRVKSILRPVSGTLSEWGLAIYAAIRQTYELLSAEAHEEEDDDPRLNPAGMVGVLRATEGLVVVLMSHTDHQK